MRLPVDTEIRVRAVLFDMDGTLVNSNAAVLLVWRQWAERHGLDGDAITASTHGRRAGDTIRAYAPAEVDLAAEVAWLEEHELAERDGIIAVPGARELIAALPPDRVALVTSAPRALAAMRLERADVPVPAVFISAENVVRGKPDPEGYLEAARRLGVDARDCLVVEDAPAGLEAGRDAGARVLAVATTLPPHELEAWDWLPDLSSLTFERAGDTLVVRVVDDSG